MQLFLDAVSRFAAACQPGASGSFLGIPPWYKYLEGETIAGKCNVVMDFPYGVGKILLAVVEIMLRAGALVAVGFVIYGGIQFILSNGEPERAKNARGTLINALIGLAICVTAFSIVTFVLGEL